MKIEFRKIPYTTSPLEMRVGELDCKGEFFKESTRLTICNFNLTGSVETICDRCGIEMSVDVNENFSLKLVDGISDEEGLETIECHDHMVDFDEVIESEINAIRSDYHYCSACIEKEGE